MLIVLAGDIILHMKEFDDPCSHYSTVAAPPRLSILTNVFKHNSYRGGQARVSHL